MADLNDVAREWLWARDVIGGLIRELRPDLTREQVEHNAAAAIARLAGHSPPLVVTTADQIGDDDEPSRGKHWRDEPPLQGDD